MNNVLRNYSGLRGAPGRGLVKRGTNLCQAVLATVRWRHVEEPGEQGGRHRGGPERPTGRVGDVARGHLVSVRIGVDEPSYQLPVARARPSFQLAERLA